LRQASLDAANLSEADLTRAELCGARLNGADLRGGVLTNADLTNACLTGAKLYGTSRYGWKTERVTCEFIHFDIDGKHRTPTDRDFEMDEFEELYGQCPVVEYVFEKGMTPLDFWIMERVVENIARSRPELGIRIDSIDARGLVPNIKLAVKHEKQKKTALDEVTKAYEERLAAMEPQRDILLDLLARKLDRPDAVNLIETRPGGDVAGDGSA